jgi:hypothetical protein
MNSYSIMHKLFMGHTVKCKFDTQKFKFPASLITVNIQSLTMNTEVEIIVCMMILSNSIMAVWFRATL